MTKSLLCTRKHVFLFVGIALVCFLPALSATLITTSASITNQIVIDFSQFNSGWVFGAGPVQVGGLVNKNVVWASGSTNSVIGSADYGLGDNGNWTSARVGCIGLNVGATGDMWFTFAETVSAVGGFMNYARGGSYPNVFISAYNSSGVLLESYNLSTLAPIIVSGTNQGGFRGIQRATNDIAKFQLSNAHIIVDDLTFSSVAAPAVPEPGTWILMGLAGLAVLGYKRK